MISARTRLAGALGTAALAVTGCGGGQGADIAKVKQTIQRAFVALADGHGSAFCALATPGARAELARTTPGASCPQVVGSISRQLSSEVKLALRHARVRTVSVDGDRASVRARDITSRGGTLTGFLQQSAAPTKLVRRSDGSWKISG